MFISPTPNPCSVHDASLKTLEERFRHDMSSSELKDIVEDLITFLRVQESERVTKILNQV